MGAVGPAGCNDWGDTLANRLQHLVMTPPIATIVGRKTSPIYPKSGGLLGWVRCHILLGLGFFSALGLCSTDVSPSELSFHFTLSSHPSILLPHACHLALSCLIHCSPYFLLDKPTPVLALDLVMLLLRRPALNIRSLRIHTGSFVETLEILCKADGIYGVYNELLSSQLLFQIFSTLVPQANRWSCQPWSTSRWNRERRAEGRPDPRSHGQTVSLALGTSLTGLWCGGVLWPVGTQDRC